MAYTKTVLVVEDEHFISELYARALRKAGYEVTIMLSGEDGLAAAMTNNYDLILLDLLIPGISGIDALHQLRGGVKPAVRSKIIITTNLDQDESNRADLEKLADGYLIKAEMTPNQLVEIVNDLFKTEPAPPQS